MDAQEEREIEKQIDNHEIDIETDDTTVDSQEITPKKQLSRRAKIIVSLLVTVLLVTIVLAVPFVRYGVFGMVVKKDISLKIVDLDSNKPISGATIKFGRIDSVSDKNGIVELRDVGVGDYRVTVEKKYYQSFATDHRVPIVMNLDNNTLKLKATGRTISLNIKNLITDKPLADVVVKVSDTNSISDQSGHVALVLPIKNEPQTATLSLKGYNDATLNLVVGKGDDQTKKVSLTPEGKTFFLSKRTGKINIMSSKLDGTDQQVLADGTGLEIDAETMMMSSPDWSRLALLSRRDENRTKLYMVNTAQGSIESIDNLNASFELIGWIGDKFYYKRYLTGAELWKPKAQTIMSYNATTGVSRAVDENAAVGDNIYNFASEQISPVYITSGKLAYAKSWTYGQYFMDRSRTASAVTVDARTDSRSSMKSIPDSGDVYVDAMLSRPGVVAYRIGKVDGSTVYYELRDGDLKQTQMNDGAFYNNRLSYLASPSGKYTAWSESRDGRNVSFVGNESGANPRQIGDGDYAVYGWFGEEYILYSKRGSELFITAREGKLDGAHKITDYHRSQIMYPGYPGGYGAI